MDAQKNTDTSRAGRDITIAVGLCVMLTALFFVAEPIATRAIDDTFIVTQSITAEISFNVTADDVTMSPSIAGLTGGTATGDTYVVVRSNSSSGYTLDISFSTTTAMQGNATNGVINNYTPGSVGVPDYTFAIGGSGTPGEFAYSAMASDTPATSGLVQLFQDDGGACNAGANQTASRCWINPSTTDQRIIDRSTPTSEYGATTTIQFTVGVPSNPSPLIPVDTYTATATLTAVNQ